MTENELERIIETLVERRYAAPEGSAERLMAERQLKGLRYTYQGAGGIIEDLDPEWGYSVRITGPRQQPPNQAAQEAIQTGSRR